MTGMGALQVIVCPACARPCPYSTVVEDTDTVHCVEIDIWQGLHELVCPALHRDCEHHAHE